MENRRSTTARAKSSSTECLLTSPPIRPAMVTTARIMTPRKATIQVKPTRTFNVDAGTMGAHGHAPGEHQGFSVCNPSKPDPGR